MTEPVPFELVNRRGQTVRGVYQRGDGPSGGERPLVVMSTAFGQTFRKYLSAAAFFSRNGWDVVRYDITNHPGLSDGNPVDMRLTWMCEDLMDVVDACAATEEWPTVAVFAASLGARVALRATAEDPRIRALAMVACVVDARATMAVANGIDWFEVWLDSDRTEVDAVRETYGGPMSARCVIDMLEHGWDGIEGTRADLERIGVPVLDVAGGCDEWVALEDVRGVFGAGKAELVVIDDAVHDLAMGDARMAMATIVSWFGRVLDVGPALETDVVEPALGALARQNRAERHIEKQWATHGSWDAAPGSVRGLPTHGGAVPLR
ncbi:MAG: alpha/beta hydrolase [Acidimicrobiia bacterium]|nr:alpha/beta hydrolase [Acidimicrobiia bacterium]